MIIWNPGNISFFRSDGSIRLYQPHYRRNLLIDGGAGGFLSWLAAGGEVGRDAGEAAGRWDAGWRIKDATSFTLIDQAYANSAMFDEAQSLGDAACRDGQAAIALLTGAQFVADRWPIAYDHEKKTPFDRFRGSFYEQIGAECLRIRKDPVEWWVAQKFEADFLTTRPTPYRYIQDAFLTNFLNERAAGRTVLEVGCGTGYFTHKAAQVAASAVGLDYNPAYIETARERWQGRGRQARFEVGDMIDLEASSAAAAEGSFDIVLLIDTFLFLFHPSYQPALYENRERILGNLASRMKPDGRLILMDPSPFFLTPWFGDPHRPFGIVESYRTHHFRVIPILEEVTALFSRCGLAIDRVHEPQPSPELKTVDAAAHAFYSEVPPWWVFEIRKAAVAPVSAAEGAA